MSNNEFARLERPKGLALGLIEASREPLLVLDQDLLVVAASHSFLSKFLVTSQNTEGQNLTQLGDGQWDIPQLFVLLKKIIRGQEAMEGYEMQYDFPKIGYRTMLLHAQKVPYTGEKNYVMLTIDDVTDRRAADGTDQEVLAQQEVLLNEIQHRIANSLQIIASLILMKAKAVGPGEVRTHLQDVHSRVISITALQEQLRTSTAAATIKVKPYLTRLADALSNSMIDETRRISIAVDGEGGTMTCREAESIGLIVTELVINSLKHAFSQHTKEGKIVISFSGSGSDWELAVIDNGLGQPQGVETPKPGLGTGIVNALAKHLGATVALTSSARGTSVSVARNDGGTLTAHAA